MDVQIRSLRSKIEVRGAGRVIQTYRGVGYALREG